MADDFESYQPSLGGPAANAAAITANDSTDLANATRGIYVGGAGDLSVVMVGGQTVTFTGLSAGVVYPLRCERVRSSGTTATNLIALW